MGRREASGLMEVCEHKQFCLTPGCSDFCRQAHRLWLQHSEGTSDRHCRWVLLPELWSEKTGDVLCPPQAYKIGPLYPCPAPHWHAQDSKGKPVWIECSHSWVLFHTGGGGWKFCPMSPRWQVQSHQQNDLWVHPSNYSLLQIIFSTALDNLTLGKW